MLGAERGYSPGPTLSPIDSPRAPRWLAPVLAALALVLVVGAVAFAVSRARDGGSNRDTAGVAPLATVNATQPSSAQPTAAGAGAAVTPTSAPADDAGAPTSAAATEAPASTAAGGSSTGGSSTGGSSSATNARALLPGASDLPAGFVRTEDDSRTQDQVANNLPDPEEAAANLDAWGWQQNAYRTFAIPADQATDPAATNFVNISVHRFADADGASQALSYFADAVISAQGLERIDVDQVGDESIALKGSPDGANLVVLYLRSGDYLIRIGGSSPQGDPTDDVVAVAKKIIG